MGAVHRLPHRRMSTQTTAPLPSTRRTEWPGALPLLSPSAWVGAGLPFSAGVRSASSPGTPTSAPPQVYTAVNPPTPPGRDRRTPPQPTRTTQQRLNIAARRPGTPGTGFPLVLRAPRRAGPRRRARETVRKPGGRGLECALAVLRGSDDGALS